MEKQNIPSLRPLLFIGCAGVCLALAFLWFFSSLSLAEERLLPVYRVKTQRPAVALTFDAAWGNQDMDQILSVLKEYDASATFFITGDFARSYSQDVRKLFLAGHCVANHSDTHPHINALSQEKALSDTLSCNQILEDLTGERPKLYRGPYGEYNDRLLTMLDEKNMVCIQWDVDSLDWKDLTKDEITRRVVEKAEKGSIVLLHCGARYTAQALPAILSGLKEKGLECVRVDELMFMDNYRILPDGTQESLLTPDEPAQDGRS